MYIDFVAEKKLGGYNKGLVVTCTLTRYNQVCLFSTKCNSQEVVKTFVQTLFKDYGAPKQMFSVEDVLFRSETA